MRAIRVAASAALLAAAGVMTAGPAALAVEGDGAVTPFGFSVTPETVAPGGTVTLTSEGCEVPSVTVTSGVFDAVTLDGGRPGTATVDVDAKAGARYEITFECQGERGTAGLTIAQGAGPEHEGDGNATGGTDDAWAHDGGADTTAEQPGGTGAHKGVKAGYGTAAAAEDDGLGTAEVVTGVLLIVGALGAAVVLARRAADGRV